MHKILLNPLASKLIKNFSETLSGVTTVRAMAAVPRFVRENEELVEASLRTTYSGQVAMMMLVLKTSKPSKS